jgi:NADPH2:quinone reductase
MKAIRVHAQGGPEVMQWEDVPTPTPGPGQVLVKLSAIGVNFMDVYQRTGAYQIALPFTPGNEGGGTVAAVGPDVTDFHEGDLVAYTSVPGAYAEYAVVPAQRLVPVPQGIAIPEAVAVMLQGMTAHYLTHSTYVLKEGDTALVQAAAGGVGLLLTQIGRIKGARIIGTVSSEAKAEVARAAGISDVILYTQEDFAAVTRTLTEGRGVDVVYDSVGKTTFDQSLDCLRPRGMMVIFGQSSGAVPPFDVQRLNAKGSLFLTRPTLVNYIATREELLWRANDLFGWMQQGTLHARVNHTFPVAEAAEAHRALESRQTTGKVLLLV